VISPLALSRERAGLFVVDIQERLVPAMPADVLAKLIANTRTLIETAKTLGLPVVVSQQYPKGLGQTVAAIAEVIPPTAYRFDKLEFSGAGPLAVAELAPELRRSQWILVGMETHVCVYQTARDLLAQGHAVHVVADAVSSRTKANWKIGMKLARKAGAIHTSTEVVVFDLLGKAGSDEFKALAKLIK
jgi:nicotinamidase-related amidase